MHWILEKVADRLDYEYNNQEKSQMKLFEILKQKGQSVSAHKVRPFLDGPEVLDPVYEGDTHAICIGPYNMRKASKDISPGVFDIYENTFEVQRENYGKRMLNYNSKVLKFGDLNTVVISEQPYFIRPIHDDKTFAGSIMTGADIIEWHKKVIDLNDDFGTTLSSETLVQITDPINIFEEYRIWAVGGKIATASLYKKGDKVITSSDVPQDVLDYAQECINIWQPHKAFVIDICTINNVNNEREFRIVEINTLNAAGFYCADLEKLVDALIELET